MNTRRLGPVAVALLALGLGAGATLLDRSSSSSSSPDESIHRAETLAITDLSDDRKLVGLAHDVFLATVVQERSSTATEPLPETQYDVQVLQAIKGSLSSGNVVVSQQGGVNDNGDTVIVDGDSPLKIGRTYLFATLTNQATGWHTLIPRYGILPADAKHTQTILLERFGTATAAQVPYTPTS